MCREHTLRFPVEITIGHVNIQRTYFRRPSIAYVYISITFEVGHCDEPIPPRQIQRLSVSANAIADLVVSYLQHCSQVLDPISDPVV